MQNKANKNIDIFKSISIRGRLAYTLLCYKELLQNNFFEYSNNKYLNLIKEYLIFLLNHDFNNSIVTKIAELEPSSILDNHVNNIFDNYEYFKSFELNEVEKLYKVLPNYFVDFIDSMMELALCNLYSDTGKYSKCTYGELEFIFKILEKEEFNFPKIPKEIINSSFTELNGWGNKCFFNIK